MHVRNRGKEGSDDRLFGDTAMVAKLKEAAKDMCYLLSRGFAEKSSVQLVGNRYKLNSRQQKALMGMSSGEKSILFRKNHSISHLNLKNQTIAIDGFNLLILLESALSGAYIFRGLDGYYRDISSVHGSYKRVQKTEEVIVMVGKYLNELEVSSVHWYFDSPVSNSGRLKTLLRELAEEHKFPWEIDLVHNPDKILAESSQIIVSSDAWVLDRAERNFNLPDYLFGEIPSISLVTAE
ncbi:DUF434 domain-containing protein [Aquimarina sp. MMG016]|uniref:DUF434 domain-containing protein n=1 Tax=Aquimarina sp. MMG016 TaxID=2822690 RepID=UPI001B3A65A6|nr:DUF434 domain-containing protein [Aquimarina sp. MMG016]MBQ4819981.1 DUF434 domain-containing protein [Aquimarina sp. MMG016]